MDHFELQNFGDISDVNPIQRPSGPETAMTVWGNLKLLRFNPVQCRPRA